MIILFYKNSMWATHVRSWHNGDRTLVNSEYADSTIDDCNRTTIRNLHRHYDAVAETWVSGKDETFMFGEV